MKRTLIFVLAVAMAASATHAQVCQEMFPQEEGTVLTYVNYDRKEKVTGSTETSLKDKKEIPGGMSVILSSVHKDDKGEKILENEVELECREGVIYFDARSLLDPNTMSAYESMEVEITGENPELPLDAAPGTSLKDGNVTATVSSGGMKIMTIQVELTNRKVEAREEIETPAGTFDCIKYSYDTMTRAGFVKANFKGIDWYSPKYGTIRSESYNSKGKPAGSMVLESID